MPCLVRKSWRCLGRLEQQRAQEPAGAMPAETASSKDASRSSSYTFSETYSLYNEQVLIRCPDLHIHLIAGSRASAVAHVRRTASLCARHVHAGAARPLAGRLECLLCALWHGDPSIRPQGVGSSSSGAKVDGRGEQCHQQLAGSVTALEVVVLSCKKLILI